MMMSYLEHARRDNGVIELRCLGPSTFSGLFDDLGALRDAALSVGESHNIFTTLNRPGDALKATNRLSMGARCSRDADIALITRLPFDFDPARPKGSNSTKAELALARERAYALWGFLRSWGWPEPLIACSGNGYHLQYRCRLPATQATTDALAILYRGLAQRCSGEKVSFDAVVRNPARIFRLYGSVNRKGPNTADRPQRHATCELPPQWSTVSRRQIFSLVDHLAPPKAPPRPAMARAGAVRSPGVDYRTLDVVTWFQSRGLYVGPQRKPGLHGVRCPWEHEHTTASPTDGGDCIIWESRYTGSGWPGFHCKHAHCDGRGILEVIRLLGDAADHCVLEG